MDAVQKLIERDRAKCLKVAVVGDAMVDRYIHGKLEPCQDGVQKFVEPRIVLCPGGAANAAWQLSHWNVQPYLIAPYSSKPWDGATHYNIGLCHRCREAPIKTRYIDDATGRIVFREDMEYPNYGLTPAELTEIRDLTVKAVRTMGFDAVLISDYDKGFLDDLTIRCIVDECAQQGIVVVGDPKRHPVPFAASRAHCALKCNESYWNKWGGDLSYDAFPQLVVTRGGRWPIVSNDGPCPQENPQVRCVNHVGAGDCFAAHLTLGLAHGLSLFEATYVAHHAGRVYVQASHNRPPWPHEIAKDMTGNKRLDFTDLRHLRESLPGKRVVFTNGVFRTPHAGHAWLMRWAKQQGDVLVVGVNTDASARSLRPGEFVLSEGERVQILESMEAVDWVVTFSAEEPIEAIRMLQPDVLCKGNDYMSQRIPGDELVDDVRYAPESPFPAHCTDLVVAIAGAVAENHREWGEGR